MLGDVFLNLAVIFIVDVNIDVSVVLLWHFDKCFLDLAPEFFLPYLSQIKILAIPTHMVKTISICAA